MGTRARTTQQRPVETEGTDVDATVLARAAAPERRSAWRQKIRSLLHREEQPDDGVFRPVRLTLWMDLGLSAAIVVVMVGAFAGFIYFLARTQGR